MIVPTRMDIGPQLHVAVIQVSGTLHSRNRQVQHSFLASNTCHHPCAPILPAKRMKITNDIKWLRNILPPISARILLQRVYRLETGETVSNRNRKPAIHIQYFQTFGAPNARSKAVHNLLLACGIRRAGI